MKATWSPQAYEDVLRIREYIALYDPDAAARVAERIVAAVKRLRDFPMSGRTGRNPDTRELAVSKTRYVTVYQVRESDVVILRVRHGAQAPDGSD